MTSSEAATAPVAAAIFRPDLVVGLNPCRFCGLKPRSPSACLMSRNNRGAAQVSLMWLIAVTVIALLAALMAFAQAQQITELEDEVTSVESERDGLRATADELRAKRRADFQSLGFAGTDGEFVAPEAIDAARNELITRFGLDSGAVTKLEDVVNPVVAEYNQVVAQRDALQTEVGSLRNDLDARRQANVTAMREKDDTIATLRSEKEDSDNAKEGQIQTLERQRDSLRDQLRDANRTITEQRALNDQQARDFSGQLAVLQQRNDILSSRLNGVERRASMADGSVLSANVELGRAWIDLGSLDRVTPGMEFEVQNASTSEVKGRLRVTSVEDHRAEATILAMADRYDPIRADDVILNAIYDPEREPIAVLLGNGFGRYTASDVTSMLARAGVQVRTSVSSETDFLLLGTAFFDEETGDIVPWETMDPYKAASSYSVSVVPLRDWSQWIGM